MRRAGKHLHFNYHGVLSVDRCGDEGANSKQWSPILYHAGSDRTCLMSAGLHYKLQVNDLNKMCVLFVDVVN